MIREAHAFGPEARDARRAARHDLAIATTPANTFVKLANPFADNSGSKRPSAVGRAS